MGYDVQNKVALVTGANRGIGRAIVDTLVAHGVSKVYAAVRSLDSAQPLVEQHGDKIVPIEIDLSKPDTITAAARQAGDVALLINNAGVLKVSDPLDPNAEDNFRFEFDVNVLGLIRVAQAFAPVLKANGGGALVQLNSVASVKNFAAFSTYSASKAASYAITQGLRDTLAQQNTQVLSVHPGPIATDMADQAGLPNGDPPSVVAEGIVQALSNGDFHLFPDTMAKQLYQAYESYAQNVVEAPMTEA